MEGLFGPRRDALVLTDLLVEAVEGVRTGPVELDSGGTGELTECIDPVSEEATVSRRWVDALDWDRLDSRRAGSWSE